MDSMESLAKEVPQDLQVVLECQDELDPKDPQEIKDKKVKVDLLVIPVEKDPVVFQDCLVLKVLEDFLEKKDFL